MDDEEIRELERSRERAKAGSDDALEGEVVTEGKLSPAPWPASRPVGHEDRLTLVEHLDELRTRIIICIAVLVVAMSLCFWQNEALLDIANDPVPEEVRLDGLITLGRRRRSPPP